MLFYKSSSVCPFSPEFWSISLILTFSHCSISNQSLGFEKPSLPKAGFCRKGLLILSFPASHSASSVCLYLRASLAPAHSSQKVEKVELQWLGKLECLTSARFMSHYLPLVKTVIMKTLCWQDKWDLGGHTYTQGMLFSSGGCTNTIDWVP